MLHNIFMILITLRHSYNVNNHWKKNFVKILTATWVMGMNICKVQKVRRVNTGRRLKISVIDIFEKFFLACGRGCLAEPAWGRWDGSPPRTWPFCQIHILLQSRPPPYKFHTHTFGSLTAEPLVLAQIRDHFLHELEEIFQMVPLERPCRVRRNRLSGRYLIPSDGAEPSIFGPPSRIHR